MIYPITLNKNRDLMMIPLIVFLMIALLIYYSYFMAMVTETQQEKETLDRPADGEAYRQELARVKARRKMQFQKAREREDEEIGGVYI